METLKAFILLSVLFTLSSCALKPEKKKEDASASIHYKMAEVHFSEKNYTSALSELTKAVEIYPGDAPSQHLLGLTYHAKGMYNEAAAHLEKAVYLNPQNAEARVNLGVVYLEMQKWDEAIPHFNAALEDVFYRTPEVARYNLGSAYYGKGDYAKAAENFRKAVELAPRNAIAYSSLGQAYDKLNMTDDAVDAYRKAISIEPLFTNAYHNLGMALLKKKDKAGALKAFEKVVELDPGSDKARSAREYIELLK